MRIGTEEMKTKEYWLARIYEVWLEQVIKESKELRATEKMALEAAVKEYELDQKAIRPERQEERERDALRTLKRSNFIQWLIFAVLSVTMVVTIWIALCKK